MRVECPSCHQKFDVPVTRNYPNPFYPKFSARKYVTQFVVPQHLVSADVAPVKTWMNRRAIVHRRQCPMSEGEVICE